MPSPHVYYNDDGNSAMYLVARPPDRELFVEHVNALAGLPITTFVFCLSNGDTCYFNSKVSSRMCWRETAAGRGNKSYARTVEIFDALEKNGWDYPAMVRQRALELGFRFIPSMRMNDAHYAQKVRPEDNPFTGKFRLEHPELTIRPGTPWPEHRRSTTPHWFMDHALSFAHEAVREFRLAAAFEIIDLYAHDGFEMDWTRHLGYFREDDVRPELITDMVRKVRAKLRAREREAGRRMELIVRVPASPAESLALGLDVATWAREGLVDTVVPSSATRMTSLDMPVHQWMSLVADAPSRVEVHASPDTLTPFGGIPLEVWRAAAANYLHMGADGVYFFNLFCLGFPFPEDALAMLRETAAGIKGLAGKNKRFLATHETWRQDTDKLFAPIPGPDRPARIGVYVGDDLAAEFAAGTLERATLRVRIDHAQPGDPIDIWLNGAPIDLSAARQTAGDSTQETMGWCHDRPHGLLGNPWFWLEVDIPAAALPKAGDTTVTVRSRAPFNRRVTDVEIVARYV